MNEQELNKLYNALLGKGYSTEDLGDENIFSQKMSDKENRKQLYDWVSSRGDFRIGDYDTYESRLTSATPSQPSSEKAANSDSTNNDGDFTMAESELSDSSEESSQDKQPVVTTSEAANELAKIGSLAPLAEKVKETNRNAATMSDSEREDADRIMRDIQRGVSSSGKMVERRSGYINERAAHPFDSKRVFESSLYNPETGKYETKYINEVGEYTNKAVAEHDQKLIDKEREKEIHPDYKERANRAQVEYMDGYIDDELKTAAEESNKIISDYVKKSNPIALGLAMNAGGMGGFAGTSSVKLENIPTGEAQALAVRIRDLEAAKRTMRDTKRIINEADRNRDAGTFDEWALTKYFKGAGRGFGQKLFDVDNWDFGFTDLKDNTSLLSALDKADKGEELTQSQIALLDAKAIELATNAYFGSYVGSGYKDGQMTAESIPYMLEMCLNPASKVGETAASKLARYAMRRFAKKAVAKSAGIATRVAADALIGAPTMAGTTGLMGVVADTEKRMAGDVTYDIDTEGRSVFAGVENRKDFGKAFSQSFAARSIENHSEMVGDYFAPVIGVVGKGFRKGLGKIGLNKINDFIDNVSTSDVARLVSDFEKNSKWNGTIGEYGEEVVGGIENAILVGDQTLDTDKDTGVFNLQNNIDTFRGVALMSGFISGFKTLGYRTPKYRARKNMIEQENLAASIFGNQEKWGQIRNTIDTGNNEDIIAVLVEVMQDESITQEQKAAALAYCKAADEYKGMLKADEKRHTEDAESVTTDLETSYDNGYTLEGQDMNDAKNNYELQRKKIGELASEELMRQIDEDPLAALAEIKNDDTWNDAEKNVAADYVNAKATYDGMMQRVGDDTDSKISASNAAIDANISKTDGMIHPAIMKSGGRKVYIVEGNVAIFEDGRIDHNGSDNIIIVRDAETGKVSFAEAHDFEYVEETINADEEKQTAAEAIRQAANTDFDSKVNGVLPFNIGDTYTILDEQGQQHTVKVVQDMGNGNVSVLVDGASEATEVSGEAIQQMSDLYNKKRAENYDAEKQAEREAKAKMEEPKGAASGTTTGEVSDTSAGEGYRTGETPAEPMPMNGEEPDFMAVAPERSHQYLYNEAGLEREEANQFIEANKKAADKELSAIQSKKPKIGTSIAKYNKEKAEWQAKVDAAQARADYWKAVQDIQRKATMPSAEEIAAQEAAQREQAIKDEEARQAEELRKREEQAALGINNVAPAIREKWDAAQKIEGARNEIVLANGERVPGKYVLVESGAATPSHNARAEFAKNEGFPVDENGQSVNDRDYERDKDAQAITRQIADNYDQRALQSPVVVTNDGIVLSGNGRTMAGELAAAHNTDGAYIEHLKNYGQQFGFTPEQVNSMQHPRVVFVPDATMPYTAETFAKFNQQEMKGQSKTEQAVKLGKIVDDATFGRIIRSINKFDTLGDFYNDTNAATQAINELRKAGAISDAQYAEMFDGDAVSAQGREILENMLIGKAFESNPDAVREITAIKSMKQSIITALAEISNNIALKDYSLESELAQAIALVYDARKNGGFKFGERVSVFARQGNLFTFDEGATVADYNNATVMMLADVINDNRVTRLKKWLSIYNGAAIESANGQLDLFTGDVKPKQDIINEVNRLLNYGTEEEQQEAIQKGRTGIQENGTGDVGNEGNGVEGAEADDTAGVGEDAEEVIYASELTDKQFAEILKTESYKNEDNPRIGYSKTISSYNKGCETLRQTVFLDGNEIGTHVMSIADYNPFAAIYKEPTERWHINLFVSSYDKSEDAWSPIDGQEFYDDILYFGNFKSEEEMISFYEKNKNEIERRKANAKKAEEKAEARRVEQTTPVTSSNEARQDVEDNTLSEATTQEAIAAAEAEVNTNPTDAQKEAGNYKKGHIKIDGFDVTIENPKGSMRSGVDASGKKWEQVMNNTYGYIRGTEGVDGDHIDVFLSDNPEEGNVFVVDQVNKDGSFDEHKVMYGFNSAEEARAAYLSNYEEGWQGLGTITDVSKEEFKKWVDSSHRKTKPFAEYKSVKPIGAQNEGGQEKQAGASGLNVQDEKVFPELESMEAMLASAKNDAEEIERMTYRSGETLKEYKDRNGGVGEKWYLMQKYGSRWHEIADILRSLNSENGRETGEAIAKITEDFDDADALLRLHKNIPVKSVLPFLDGAKDTIKKKETSASSSDIETEPKGKQNGTKTESKQKKTSHKQDEKSLRDEARRTISKILSGVKRGEGVVASEEEDAAIQQIADMYTDAEERLNAGVEDEQERKRLEAVRDEADNWLEENVRSQKTPKKTSRVAKTEAKLRDALIKMMRFFGLDVVTDTAEGQKIVDAENGSVKAMARLDNLAKAASTIKRWLQNDTRNKVFRIELPISTIRKIRAAMGRDFDSHNITANGIAHGLAEHGVNGRKLNANSIPVRNEDAELIPYIMTAPDYVTAGSIDPSGRKSIRFYKNLSNGYVVVVEKEYKSSPDDMETINIWAELSSSKATDARGNAPGINVQNAILSTEDAAKIRKDAETAIENDEKIKQQRTFPVFYSNAARAVEGIKQEKATPEQWLKMIEKQGGLKAGEDKWLGLSDWLKGQDAKTLTKQEVLDFIRENQVQVEDWTYVENADGFEELKREYDGWLHEGGYDYAHEQLIERFGDDADIAFDDIGGELVIDNGEAAATLLGSETPINSTRLEYTTEGLEHKREIALVVPTIESWNESDEVHFGDAGEGRAVAWVRFGETTDAQGNRVLVIDEIQSKRHQEGREKGYTDGRLQKEYREKRDASRKAYMDYLNRVGDIRAERGLGALSDSEVEEIKENDSEASRLYSLYTEAAKDLRDFERDNPDYEDKLRDNLIPDAPFEKNWHELAMKRMLRYAAENGFDKIAWTKGEQQAERYNLSEKVDEIKVADRGNGKYIVIAIKDGGILINEEVEGEDKLSNIIGKELAKKAINGLKEGDKELLNEDGAVSFTGDNLKIGGEGMKGFYDYMLPKFMDKYGKKWGVKTGEVELPNVEEAGRKMWAVDVTPEMKASVMEGQPMFFRTKNGQVYGFTLNGKIYIDPRIATAETPIHEYTHLWAEALSAANPEAWEKLKQEMLGQKDVMDYVKRLYPELEGDALIEEVFAHYAGKRGAERLREEMQAEMEKAHTLLDKAGVVAMFDKIRKALRDFWNMARDLFAGNSKMVADMTGEDFADMMMSDLMGGFDPTAVRSEREKKTLINPRNTVPNVRGGWNERKIKDYLKHNSTRSGVYTAARAISEFDNVEELKDHMFYHGTVYGGEKLKPSITMSERDAERYGGGGYGERYWGISLTKSKKVASHFSGTSNGMRIYPVILLKGAKVVERPDMEDAADLEEHIVELWNDGVDAVWIGKGKQGEGEQELCVINPRAVVNIGTPDSYKVYQLGTKENPLRIADDAAIEKMYETAKEYASFPKPNKPFKPIKPSRLNDKLEWKSDEEYAAEMDAYEQKLSDYEQRMEEYNNSEELQKWEEFQKKMREDIRFQFVGEQGAAEADRAEGVVTRIEGLATAKQMEKDGKPALNIKIATGWERGKDGKWRYETQDFDVDIEAWERASEMNEGEYISLPELIGEDDILFKEYPDLANIKVYPNRIIEEGGYYESPHKIVVSVRNTEDFDTFIFTLLHEVQHAIQDREGFARGIHWNAFTLDGATAEELHTAFMIRSDAEKLIKQGKYKRLGNAINAVVSLYKKNGWYKEEDLDYPSVLAYDYDAELLNEMSLPKAQNEAKQKYWRNAGEVEARNVERRAIMIPEERRRTLAEDTEDVKREEQIIGRGSSTSASIADNAEAVINRYKELSERYNGKPYTIVTDIDSVPDEEFALAIGVSREEIESMSPEKLHEDVKELKDDAKRRKVSGGYSPETEKIVIFAENLSNPSKTEEAFFHENIHGILHDLYGNSMRTIAERFYKDSPKHGYFVEWDWVNEKYKDKPINERNEEFFAYSLSRAMTQGRVGELLEWLAEDDNERIGNILNAIGYDRRTEEDQRRAERAEGAAKEEPTQGDLGRYDEGLLLEGNENLQREGEVTLKRNDDVLYRTSSELFEEYPTWLSGQTTDTGQHTTQITSTVKTYNRIGDWMKRQGMDGAKVLDASSGLGTGTTALRDMGFDVDDVEPYPSENREAPTYTRYEDVDGEYDVVISNAVLNVIPDDWRADILKQMAAKVREGGKLIINVRDAKSIESQKQKIVLDSPSEILVTDSKGNIRAYQKGFTKQELKDWVQSELGEGWEVETANEENSGIKSGTAVVVTRTSEAEEPRYREIEVATQPQQTRRSPYTKKQYEAYRQREWKRMVNAANDAVEKLHLEDVVEIKETAEGVDERDANAKGFFNPRTGKITIILVNNRSAEDVLKTILHEGVAHYGLRKLFGSHFNTFLDNVYKYSSEDVRREITRLAMNKYNLNFHRATEEYLARLAEDTDFEKADKKGWWQAIKRAFVSMMKAIGYNTYGGEEITDNELRYLLWRSYKNLEEPGMWRSLVDEAEDIAMQARLGVGRFEKETQKSGSAEKADTSWMIPQAAENENYHRDVEDERDRAIVRDRYERMMQSGTYQFREAVQDSMLSLRRLMEEIDKATGGKGIIEDIASQENAYILENALSSSNHAQQRLYGKILLNPLLDEIKRLKEEGATRDEVTRYMMAKHGLERNQVMAQKAFEKYQQEHPQGGMKFDDFVDDYAGLTALTGEEDVTAADAAAQQLVDDFEAAHDTTELWARVNACTKATLQKQYEGGLLSMSAYKSIRDMYKFYIPLRGFDETTSDEVYGYLNNDAPAYSSVMKRARGRKSMADDPIATIANMADAGIMQANRNLMKLKFLRFVNEHPSDLVSVSEVWLRHDDVNNEWVVETAPINDNDTPEEVIRKTEEFNERMKQLSESDPEHYKSGKDAIDIPYKTINGNQKQHQVLVKSASKTFVITINGNPRAAMALNGLTNPDTNVGGLIGWAQKNAERTIRQMSAFYTTRNPEFVLSNFLRDMMYANSTMWVRESHAYALKFNKNYWKTNPVMIYRLIQKHNSGTLDMNNEIEGAFYDFMMNGGETGYTNIKDIEKQKKLIKKYLKEGNALVLNAEEVWDIVGDKLDEFNRSVENCARFAAFLTSRQMGRTIARSVYDAKEVSVNFNKKGSGSKFVGATGQTYLGNFGAAISGYGRAGYVFWNASIQGVTNFGRLHKRHTKKAIAYDTALFALGALMAYCGGGDDDDYWKLPEYVRRNNICIKIPFTHNFFKIPLGQEMRAIYGMGELAASVLSGRERMDKDELANAIIGQLSQTMPFDFVEARQSGSWAAYTPTQIRPIMEVAANRNWMGYPIYNDSEFYEKDPEWKKANKRTNKYLVEFSKACNEFSGGDDVKRGWLNWNPSKVENLIEGYLGGYATTVNKVVKMYETATDKQDFDWSNMFLASRVIAGADEEVEARRIKSEYYKYKKEYEDIKYIYDGYKKLAESDDTYKKKLEELKQSDDYIVYNVVNVYDKLVNELETAKEEADDTNKKNIEEQENELRKEMVELMREVKGGNTQDVDSNIDEMLKREFSSGNSVTRRVAGNAIAKRLGAKEDYYGTHIDSDKDKAYDAYRDYIDLAGESLMSVAIKEAKELAKNGDYEGEDRLSELKKARNEINELKEGLLYPDRFDPSEVMKEIRKIRQDAIDKYGKH